VPRPPTIAGPDTDLAYAAAQKVVEVHHRLSQFLRVGQTLPQIDDFVARNLADLDCKSCFLGYQNSLRSPKFPSYSCLSVNDCIVHGTAGYYAAPMRAGDILKIDIGVTFRGWIGDAGWTYVFGEPSDEVRRLVEAGKESLRRGIQELRPGNTYLDWARTVQEVVERDAGFHLVRGLGGHGYGRKLHAPPFVSNVVPSFGESPWPDANTPCTAGTLVAVEPMLAIGTGRTADKVKGYWPIFTADGSLAVHYEHDILITADGPRVLTEGLDAVQDIVG
jgi:methionyl aminopeptidase